MLFRIGNVRGKSARMRCVGRHSDMIRRMGRDEYNSPYREY